VLLSGGNPLLHILLERQENKLGTWDVQAALASIDGGKPMAQALRLREDDVEPASGTDGRQAVVALA
jgi:hypothetical protein